MTPELPMKTQRPTAKITFRKMSMIVWLKGFDPTAQATSAKATRMRPRRTGVASERRRGERDISDTLLGAAGGKEALRAEDQHEDDRAVDEGIAEGAGVGRQDHLHHGRHRAQQEPGEHGAGKASHAANHG